MIKDVVDGVLLLDKPVGISSNNALQQVRRIYLASKAGHTGTLDPLATGVLPICFGEATKFSRFLLHCDKEYIASIRLGISTTTYDAEGDITKKMKVNCNKLQIQECVSQFIGTITQYPPIFSAVKLHGRPLYHYARNCGTEDIQIKPRQVHIYELQIIEFIDEVTFKLRVLCSSGTYIRSLASDIGHKLQCGAYLCDLVRTKTGCFQLHDCCNFATLSRLSFDTLRRKLLKIDVLVEHLNKIELNTTQFNQVKYGHKFTYNEPILAHTQIRLYYNDVFLGIGQIIDNYVQPIRLLNILG